MVAGAASAFTSCEKFLTITPTNSIVEEEFWQDKNDLNNAIYGCYKKMASDGIVGNMICWGEWRSDNVERATSTSATGELANIMNANLIPTYGAFSWTGMYNVINYCNKVLAHGPEVVANDESFSERSWEPIKAEITAMRALCHFYLVRTFGEIPYMTEDINNDSQELLTTQVPQLTVLDNIISDLEAVKDQSMTDFGSTMLNKGRITRKAIYTLLADVYLWRASYKAGNCHPFINRTLPSTQTYYTGEVPYVDVPYGTSASDDYQKCVYYCDEVINMAKQEYIKDMNKILPGAVEFDIEDLLVQNVSTRSSIQSLISNRLGAYKNIFGTGNSDESIFELQFDGDTYGNNTIHSSYMDTKGKTGSLVAPAALFEPALESPNTTTPAAIFPKTDYRKWETLLYDNSAPQSYTLIKYAASTISQQTERTSEMVTDNTKMDSYISSIRSKANANWIVYRMSEVFLMKAEAISCLYPSDPTMLENGYNYVRAVFKRSNPYAYELRKDTLKFEGNFDTGKALESLVMQERQREFICEGKRWFDLVRYAQRRGNTTDMLAFLTRKYADNRKAIEAKLADMQSLFSPVNNGEIKNNPWLYQNGVWKLNESSSRTDKM